MAPPQRSAETKDLLNLAMAEDTFLYSSDWPHQTLDPATWAFNNSALNDARPRKINRCPQSKLETGPNAVNRRQDPESRYI